MKTNPGPIAGVLLACAWLLTTPFPAHAQSAGDAPPGGPPPWGAAHGGPPHPMGPGHLFHQLNLSDTQKQSMHALMSAAGPDLKVLHDQFRANLQRLRAITPDDPNYAAVLAEVSQSNGNLHTQIATQEGALYAQMFALLTPAQKTQLAGLQAKMESGAGRGEWRKPPPAAEPAPPMN